MKKIDLAAVFLTISIIFMLIAPESDLGIACLFAGDLLLLYSLIKEKLSRKK